MQKPSAQKIAAQRLREVDASIDEMFKEFGFSHADEFANYDAIINKQFVRDITALLSESTDGEIGEYGK